MRTEELYTYPINTYENYVDFLYKSHMCPYVQNYKNLKDEYVNKIYDEANQLYMLLENYDYGEYHYYDELKKEYIEYLKNNYLYNLLIFVLNEIMNIIINYIIVRDCEAKKILKSKGVDHLSFFYRQKIYSLMKEVEYAKERLQKEIYNDDYEKGYKINQKILKYLITVSKNIMDTMKKSVHHTKEDEYIEWES